jgi:tetratricopeptide (TPR) repeat protein
MADEPPSSFLDVPTLLDASQPRARVGWFWYALGAFLLVVGASTLIDSSFPNGRRVVSAISTLALFGIMFGMAALTWSAAKAANVEVGQLESLEELVRLRRWDEARAVLESLLSRPTRNPHARTQALVFLAAVLARFHRFGDAVSVYEHVLEHKLVEGEGAYGLKLGRAMALLREDRLFDADRAINELRRGDPARESAGLAMVEIYRDVKTGHPREALEVFERKLPALRSQLGHRVADGWALAARAYDQLGEEGAARQAYENATLLSSETELHRRYPEVARLQGKYSPAAAPTEAA